MTGTLFAHVPVLGCTAANPDAGEASVPGNRKVEVSKERGVLSVFAAVKVIDGVGADMRSPALSKSHAHLSVISCASLRV